MVACDDDLELVREALGPNILYLQDQAAVVAGLKVWGSPWQPEFNAWAFNLPRGDALAERWALIPRSHGSKDSAKFHPTNSGISSDPRSDWSL